MMSTLRRRRSWTATGILLATVAIGFMAAGGRVLDAQRSLFRSELDLALLQPQELAATVELYRALGGGWNE